MGTILRYRQCTVLVTRHINTSIKVVDPERNTNTPYTPCVHIPHATADADAVTSVITVLNGANDSTNSTKGDRG